MAHRNLGGFGVNCHCKRFLLICRDVPNLARVNILYTGTVKLFLDMRPEYSDRNTFGGSPMNSKMRAIRRETWRNTLLLVPVGLLLAALVLGMASPAGAATQPVTVTINYLEQLGDPDLTTRGDYYAKIFINNVQQNTPALDFGF